MKSVQVIELPTRKEFERKWLRLGVPLIIRGGIEHWKAREQWSLDFFKLHHGEVRIWCEDGELFEFKRKAMTLGAFVDTIRDPNFTGKLYWSEARLFDVLPGLRSHVELERPDLFPRAFLAKPKIYIGPRGSFSPIHRDRAPNITAQIVGRKRWTFYSPEQGEYVYPYPWRHFLGHFSRINTEDKLRDFKRFPLFRRAEPLEAVVEPGDLIYSPAGWWHHVKSLDATISVHIFWKTLALYASQVALKPVYKLLDKRQQSDVVADWSELDVVRRVRELFGGALDAEAESDGERARRAVRSVREGHRAAYGDGADRAKPSA